MKNAISLALCVIGLICRHSLATEPVDLLIANARVIDGSGRPWFYADVAVSDEDIVAVGRDLDIQAIKRIDARRKKFYRRVSSIFIRTRINYFSAMVER